MSVSVAQPPASLSHLKLTERLRSVIPEVERLSAEDQDLLAAIILREIRKAPAPSSDDEPEEESLQALLQEARQELHDGKTKPMSKDCVIADD